MFRIQSKITLHTKNQESLNTEMTWMELLEKNFTNEEIKRLSRKIEDTENNQIENFKTKKLYSSKLANILDGLSSRMEMIEGSL